MTTSLQQQQNGACYTATEDILDFYQDVSPRQDLEDAPRSASALSLPSDMSNRLSLTPSFANSNTNSNNNTPTLRRTRRHIRPRPLSMTSAVFDDDANDISALHDEYPAINLNMSRTDSNTSFGGANTPTTTGLNNINTPPSRLGVRSRTLTGTKRYSSLPASKHRQSASFGGSALGVYSNTESPFPPPSASLASRPRSGVWDEIEAVRERIQKLRTATNSNQSPSSNKSSPLAKREPESEPGQDMPEQEQDPEGELEPQQNEKNTEHYESGNLDEFEEQVQEQYQDQNPPHKEYDDWDRQEPVSAIMSSPIASRNGSGGGFTDGSSSNKSASPTLTRQSPAERHLLETIERARRVRDHDILVVMLERVVTDTMSLYNHCDPKQSESIDRVCLSLSDFIIQFLESSAADDINSNVFPPTPSYHHRRFTPKSSTSSINSSASTATLNTPVRQNINQHYQHRYTPSMAASRASVTTPASLWYDNHNTAQPPHLSSYRRGGGGSEYGYNSSSSPISRTQTASPLINSSLPPSSSSSANRRLSRRFDSDRSTGAGANTRGPSNGSFF